MIEHDVRCSACGRQFTASFDPSVDEDLPSCPNCGTTLEPSEFLPLFTDEERSELAMYLGDEELEDGDDEDDGEPG